MRFGLLIVSLLVAVALAAQPEQVRPAPQHFHGSNVDRERSQSLRGPHLPVPFPVPLPVPTRITKGRGLAQVASFGWC